MGDTYRMGYPRRSKECNMRWEVSIRRKGSRLYLERYYFYTIEAALACYERMHQLPGASVKLREVCG